jgi:hypothetical protein
MRWVAKPVLIGTRLDEEVIGMIRNSVEQTMDFEFEEKPTLERFGEIGDQEWEIVKGDHRQIFGNTRRVAKKLPIRDCRSLTGITNVRCSDMIYSSTRIYSLLRTRCPFIGWS